MKKKYNWIIIVALSLIIALPFILNWVMQWNTRWEYVGDDTDWLQFFGAYLSSVVAFIILWITYNQNRKENKQNRNLQLKTIKYQQQKDLLNQLNDACIEYVFSFNDLDFQKLCSYATTNRIEIYGFTKSMRERIIKADTRVGFLMQKEKSEYANEYNRARHKYFNDYLSKIEDINKFVYLIHPLETLTFDKIRDVIGGERWDLTYNFRGHILKSTRFSEYPNDISQAIFSALADYSKSFVRYFEDFREVNRVFIEQEKVRIDNSLTEDYQ